MLNHVTNAGKVGWPRTFVMGVAAGLTAQALPSGWHWLRQPATAAAPATAGTPPATDR